MERIISLAAEKCLALALAFFLAVLFAACATLPDTRSLILEMPHKDPAPEIFGSRGELSSEKRKAIIHRLEKQAGSTDLLRRQIPLLESISDLPLVTGNRVTLLVNGPDTYAAMFRAIQGARDHVNFETFTFDDDETGRRFADLLLQKRAEGVQVNLIYDSAGSYQTPPSFFERLRRGGVNVVEFNPISRSDAVDAADRDHRKILVVDGRIAFTGGVNIGRAYSESMYGEYGERGGKLSWRDTDIRVEGPVVAEFQKLFLDTWTGQKGPKLATEHFFPSLKKVGNDLARVVGSTPGKRNRVTYMMYVAAVTFADNSIHLTNAYFVPNKEMVNALTGAAARGVDVKIILPGRSDSALVFRAGRSYYSRLLKAGVKLYERRARILHAKTGVVDGVWSTVGSTNLELWSFLRDNEVNAVILGKDFAGQMETMFKQDLANSNQIQLKEWENRPLIDRFEEWFARAFEYWL
jgi:cardiolipin synthase